MAWAAVVLHPAGARLSCGEKVMVRPDPRRNDRGRLLRINTPLGEDVLLLEKFEGEEEISELFAFTAIVLSQRTDLQPADLIGKLVDVSLAAGDAVLAGLAESLLSIIAVMTQEVEALTKRVLAEVKVEPTCRRLMTVPRVGPLIAFAFRATIDQPGRFRKSRDVGAHLGQTPRRYQSGETDVQGRIKFPPDEGGCRVVPVGTMGEAISLRVRNRMAAMLPGRETD